MLINSIRIFNFRNLNTEIYNDEKVKFIFGDNGVGKSNILELLNIIFNKSSFAETDFADTSGKIEVVLTLELNEIELGHFDDLFELENPNRISIKIVQENPKSRIEFSHLETETIISHQKLKSIAFVYYNSVQSPEELSFSKSKTAGKFLNSIIDNYIDSNNIESNQIVNEDKVSEITNNINTLLGRLKVIKSNEITAKIDNKSVSLIAKLINLSDSDNISINSMGSGIRYTSYIFFEILNTIMNTLKYSENAVITDINGEKHLPIIIALDEPEIHLHPYMQRKIIKDINNIIENKDEDFLSILKECFKIDKLIGQAIISTHSPYILSDNYKEYIRLYKSENKVYVSTGSNINFDRKMEKHLFQQAPYIKESFFSNVTLLFEGISESGSIPYFSEKINVDLDRNNICVISADGEGSVKKIKQLLEKFKINVVAVLDRDVYSLDDERNGILYTDERDLECDIVRMLINNRALRNIIKIVNEYEERGLNRSIQKSVLLETSVKLNITITIDKDYTIREAIKSKDDDLLKVVLISWLWKSKDIIRGRVIGKYLDVHNIPNVYKVAIQKAKEIAGDV